MRRHLDDLLYALGIASLAAGGFFISLPVGFFMLGACLVATAVLWAKASARGRR